MNEAIQETKEQIIVRLSIEALAAARAYRVAQAYLDGLNQFAPERTRRQFSLDASRAHLRLSEASWAWAEAVDALTAEPVQVPDPAEGKALNAEMTRPKDG
jgi:hypothetical protein